MTMRTKLLTLAGATLLTLAIAVAAVAAGAVARRGLPGDGQCVSRYWPVPGVAGAAGACGLCGLCGLCGPRGPCWSNARV